MEKPYRDLALDFFLHWNNNNSKCIVFFVAFSSTIESKCKALILWYNPIMNWKAISTLENRNPYFNSFLMSFNCTIGASWQTFLIRRSNLWGATESRNWNVGQLPLRVLFTQLNNSQLLARNLGFNHVTIISLLY